MTRWIVASLAASLGVAAHAADLSVEMHEVSADGIGAAIGTVTIDESEYGAVFTPNLKGLQPGIHGFHVHAKGSCEPAESDGKMTAAAGAGGHWDPQETGKHDTPWGEGHMGDLPALLVTADGSAKQPVLAPRIDDLEALKGHALMIHAGGDNYADQPKPLGGGGARMACGVIQ